MENQRIEFDDDEIGITLSLKRVHVLCGLLKNMVLFVENGSKPDDFPLFIETLERFLESLEEKIDELAEHRIQ